MSNFYPVRPLKDLERAYKNFFQKRAAFPRFKKRGQNDAFRYPQGVKLNQENSRIFLPKLGWIRYRDSRQVTVSAVMLEKVMALVGSEMKRLYAVGSENGGDGDAFVREEREAMDVVLQALDGENR